MPLLSSNTILSNVVLQYPGILPVLQRFGIRIGLGELSIAELCKKHEIDQNFFLVILNLFMNEDYFPKKQLSASDLPHLISYLELTNLSYQKSQLPNIERHLGALLREVDPESLAPIKSFFDSFRSELLNRIETDDQNYFPACLRAYACYDKNQIMEVHISIHKEVSTSDPIEEALADLIQLLIKYVRVEADPNLEFAVVFALQTLLHDVRQNNRIRYRMLGPIEEALRSNLPQNEKK